MTFGSWNKRNKRWSLKKISKRIHCLPFDYLNSVFHVRFWRSYNDQLLAAEQQTAQLATLRAAYAADSATLDKLERTNVYNDAFCIGHDGVFGTINGLRLGRVPGVPVGDSHG